MSAADDTVHGLLDARAAARGDDRFLTFDDRDWSFAQIARASARLAGGLAVLGVGKGDKVAIMMGNRPEFLLTWFALSRLGAVEVPVNTAHRGALLHYMLDQADCALLVMEAAFAEAVGAVIDRLPALRGVVMLDDGADDGPDPGWPGGGRDRADFAAVAAAAPPGDLPPVAASDPMAIVFTSGTTGPSKGVVLPQAYALRQAEIIVDACGYTSADRLYNALPLFHGNAQFLSTMPALLAGASMVLARRFSASSFWGDVRRHRCTEFNYIGGILPILMKAPPAPDDTASGLRLMMGAGAPAELFAAFEARFAVPLVEGYGMTEIGVPFINRLDDRHPGSCGRTRGTHQAMLVDDDGREVGAGETGELLVRPLQTNGMMSEYHAMPAETVAAWRDLWFHTGDYLRRDDAGRYFFVDRKKDALRRRGENISSFEVERGVGEHRAVLESAAVAVRSDLGEDEVMVCVVLRPGETATPLDIVRHCEATMARFMVPRYVRLLPALPKTPTERVQKAVLRAEGVAADTYDRDADPAWAGAR